MSDLEVSVQRIPGFENAAVVVVRGSIDAKTVIQFQRKLNSVIEEGINRIVVDMEEVKYVNSTGLGYLINLADTVSAEQGGVVFSNIQPKVKVVFDMLGLNAFFRIYNGRDQAIRALTGAAVAAPGPTAATLPPEMSKTQVVSPSGTPPPTPSVEPARPPVPAAPPPPPPALASPVAGDRVTLECRLCKTLLTVEGTGTYKCPRCFAMFNYSGPDRVVFMPKRPIYPVQLTLNFAPECTEGLVDFVALFSKKAAFSEAEAQPLAREVRDLVDRIKTVAYAGNENNIYHVQVLSRDSEIELRFVDYGKPIDPASLKNLRGVVDRLDIRTHPRGGNIVTLAKKKA